MTILLLFKNHKIKMIEMSTEHAFRMTAGSGFGQMSDSKTVLESDRTVIIVRMFDFRVKLRSER